MDGVRTGRQVVSLPPPPPPQGMAQLPSSGPSLSCPFPRVPSLTLTPSSWIGQRTGAAPPSKSESFQRQMPPNGSSASTDLRRMIKGERSERGALSSSRSLPLRVPCLSEGRTVNLRFKPCVNPLSSRHLNTSSLSLDSCFFPVLIHM